MVYDYLITFKKPDFKIADIFSQLLYLVTFAAFIFFATKLNGYLNVYSIAALVLTGTFIFLKYKFNKQGQVYYTAGFAIAAIVFFTGPYSNWLIGLFFVACLLLERELKFNKEAGFTENEIVFNTIIKQRHSWSEFNNLLIKDGIITFDFINNNVLQKEIEGDVSPAIEKEFNSFCHRQMQLSKQVPLKTS